MIVLGLDPSLTNFGWALHDSSAPLGAPTRCSERGRWRTSSKEEFILRYISQRESLKKLIRSRGVKRVGIEFPIFNDLWSEGMYGLFLYSCEALRECKCDVVFWTAMQAKAHARESIVRPKGWMMEKADMVEVAKMDTGGGSWNHNEADAYLVGRLAARFWRFFDGELREDELTPTELQYFTRVHTITRGERAGKTIKTGMLHREDDRFFLWSTTEKDNA